MAYNAMLAECQAERWASPYWSSRGGKGGNILTGAIHGTATRPRSSGIIIFVTIQFFGQVYPYILT